MEYLNDLSYSKIVNLIQGDEIIAGDMIDDLAIELEAIRKFIEEQEAKLKGMLFREQMIISAGQHVARHLKKELPLSVQRQKYVVVLSNDNLKIERNVI